MIEEWRDVVGFEEFYQVSNKGRVVTKGRIVYDSIGRERHLKPKMMKQSVSGKRKGKDKGYLCVRLTRDKDFSISKNVHTLVAEAFIPNTENKRTVNHKDGDKHNNVVSNLEWNTDYENITHAVNNGLVSYLEPVYKVDLNTNQILDEYISIHEAGRENNINYRNIHLVCKGKRNMAGGYGWKYKNKKENENE